jgi:hypothetical protein
MMHACNEVGLITDHSICITIQYLQFCYFTCRYVDLAESLLALVFVSDVIYLLKYGANLLYCNEIKAVVYWVLTV